MDNADTVAQCSKCVSQISPDRLLVSHVADVMV